MRRARFLGPCVGLLLWCRLLFGATPAGSARPDLLAQAEAMLDAAALTHDASERFRLADDATRLCERAAAARPKDPEPLLRMVRALTVPDPAHPELCRTGKCEQALELLRRASALDPLALEAARIAAEEGIVLSRMQRFEEAMIAYERALPLVEATRRPGSLDERPSSVLLWGNSAETAMALGRLDEAIRRYELALEHAAYGEHEWTLALYGLAVALDRDGQIDRARRTLERALERDPSLSNLHADSVFFSPPGDLHYYEGLAHELAGDPARAIEAFTRYLRAQPGSRWQGRAQAHLRALQRKAALTPRPSVTVTVGNPVADRRRRSPDSIRARVAAHEPELRLCYERLLRARPGVTVSLQLALEIAPMGFVAGRPRVLTASESALELSRCVELAADGWRFGASPGGEPELVLVPLDFSVAAAPRPVR